MTLVLSAAKSSPGNMFTLGGGRTYAQCDTHAGGTWTLQMQSTGKVWTDVEDVTFDGTGVQQFSRPRARCAVGPGGMTGARIYSTNVL